MRGGGTPRLAREGFPLPSNSPPLPQRALPDRPPLTRRLSYVVLWDIPIRRSGPQDLTAAQDPVTVAPRMWTVRSLCTAILAACKLSSPCIERAAWAACAEGAVPPRLRRAVTVPGTKAGHGSAGGLGLPKPRPLAARRAGDPPLPPQKQKRPEEGEFFRPGRPPRQPRTACPPVRRAQVVGCGEICVRCQAISAKRCPAGRNG